MPVRLIAFFAAVMLAACSSPMEKSVLEPLTSSEIDKVAGKDNSFLATYSIVEEKGNYISTFQDSLKWRDITYGRLHSYLSQIREAQINSPLFANLRNQWEQLYAHQSSIADTIITHWNNYLEMYNPNNLASVKFDGIETEFIRNVKKEIDTLLKARIKIYSSVFPVDSLYIEYSFINDILPEDTSRTVLPNVISYRKVIRDSAALKVYPKLDAATVKFLMQNDTNCRFVYNVARVHYNGKCYCKDSIQNDVPQSVLNYIDAQKSDSLGLFDEQFYKESIIRELVKNDFSSQSAFIKHNAENFYRDLDPLVFSYLELNGRNL